MNLVTPLGLGKSFSAHQKIIEVIEANCTPVGLILCEPKMSDRGLRPTLGKVGSANSGRDMMNLIAYADGTRTLLEIAELINAPAWELKPTIDMLAGMGVLKIEAKK